MAGSYLNSFIQGKILPESSDHYESNIFYFWHFAFTYAAGELRSFLASWGSCMLKQDLINVHAISYAACTINVLHSPLPHFEYNLLVKMLIYYACNESRGWVNIANGQYIEVWKSLWFSLASWNVTKTTSIGRV